MLWDVSNLNLTSSDACAISIDVRYACGNGQIAVAQVLVEHAASVDLFDGLTHTTPLMMAARGGHYEVAKLLLLAKADVSIKDTKVR